MLIGDGGADIGKTSRPPGASRTPLPPSRTHTTHTQHTMLLSLLLIFPLVFGSVSKGRDTQKFTVDLCGDVPGSSSCGDTACTAPDGKEYRLPSCRGKEVRTNFSLGECIVQNISWDGLIRGAAFGFYPTPNDDATYYSLVTFRTPTCNASNPGAVLGSVQSGECSAGPFTTGGETYGGFIPNALVAKEAWEEACRRRGGSGGGLPGWAIALIVGGVLALVAVAVFATVGSSRRSGYNVV